MSEIPAGLESLSYCFAGGRPAGAFAPVLVGVVGSGNLEVMLESTGGDGCPVGGVRVSINDMGATPAVVSLRLDQALAELQGGQP